MSGDLEQARREAEAARLRMMSDVRQLQERLRPTNLAEEAAETVKAKGQRAVALARRNPFAASAGAVGLLLIVARKPIAKLFRRWRGKPQD